jgi:manganese efflux pump family protein
MTTGGLVIAPLTAVSLQHPSERPLGTATLIAWVLTASIGAYMLRTWIARGGLRRQRATGVGVPAAVVFGHASAAACGLVIWISYLSSGWDLLAWLGLAVVATTITLGICMVTLWTPYPIRPDPGAAGQPAYASGTGPVRPDIARGTADRPPAATGELPDAFTVTDEMIASLLAEPFAVRRRRRLQLVPLIPVAHGFAALATFLLAMLTAVSGR